MRLAWSRTRDAGGEQVAEDVEIEVAADEVVTVVSGVVERTMRPLAKARPESVAARVVRVSDVG